MTTNVLRRGLAFALVALFVAGTAAEAAALHECPHHHGGSSSAGHGHGHGDPAGSPGDAAPEGACTCIGTCHGSASVALPVGGADATVGLGDVSHGSSMSIASLDIASCPYLLPYPTGPPTS